MRLSEYLDLKDLTNAQFADELGVERETVRRWRNGERMPRPADVSKIVKATSGAVTPIDLHSQFCGAGAPTPRRMRARPRAGAA